MSLDSDLNVRLLCLIDVDPSLLSYQYSVQTHRDGKPDFTGLRRARPDPAHAIRESFHECRGGDGTVLAADCDQHEHQGAFGLFVCAVCAGWRPGSECAVYSDSFGLNEFVSLRYHSLAISGETEASLCSAVKYQMKLHANDLKPGDVLMTNSPHAGGSYVSPS